MDGHWVEFAIRLTGVLLLVIANGFFVASEFALVGVRRTRVDTLARSGNRRATRLKRVLGSLDSYISATQLGITLASLALGWVGEETIAHALEPALERMMPEAFAIAAAETVAIAGAFAIITFLHIVLGELAPKTLALERAEGVALAIAWPMEMFYRAFKAPIWVLNKAGNVVVRAFGLRATAEHTAAYTEEELRYLVDISHKSGHLNEGERELLHNVFEFAAETVRDCMVPRTEVVAAPGEATMAQTVDLFRESEFSRIPVYEGSLDAVAGVLHAREVLAAALEGSEATAAEMARPTLFVPPSAQLDEVLSRMKRTGHHLAVVVDEHGGLEGIVTLEDVLEELVGEIRDELDEGEGEPIVRQKDGSHLVDAGVSVRALNRKLGLEIPESPRYATLAGFLLAETGAIPRPGEEVAFGDTRFVVEQVRRNRVLTVRVRTTPPASGAGSGTDRGQ
jgi:CBS domain containing-hemolysin-like protein